MAIEHIGPSWTLGDRLAKARREAGLQAQEMADIFGVSRNTISAWEHDTVEIKASVVRRWADLTHVSVAWLLPDEREDGDGRGPHRAPAAGAATLPLPVERTEEEDNGEARKVEPSGKTSPTVLVTSSRKNEPNGPCGNNNCVVHHAEPGDKAA